MSEKKNTKKETWKKLHEGAQQEAVAVQNTATQKNESATKSAGQHEEALEPSYQSLKTQLTETQDQLEKSLAEARRYQEQATYHLAEMENIRRRSQLDIENAYKFSLEKIIKELLAVKDYLESALNSLQEKSDSEHAATLKGIQLTDQALHKVLEKHGVKVIAPLPGEAFDAHYHQAMLTEPHAEYEANTIVKILQKGYLLQERLMRPALVVVAQASNKKTS